MAEGATGAGGGGVEPASKLDNADCPVAVNQADDINIGADTAIEDSSVHTEDADQMKSAPKETKITNITAKAESTLSKFDQQVRVVLERVPVHACGACASAFTSRATLRAHVRAAHSAPDEADSRTEMEMCAEKTDAFAREEEISECSPLEVALRCPKCHKRFAQKDALRMHMKRRDTLKKHVCDMCCKAFKHAHDFVVHMREHGEYIDEREACDRMFSHKDESSYDKEYDHIRGKCDCMIEGGCKKCKRSKGIRKKSGPNSVSYSCAVCKRSFLNVTELNIHKKAHPSYRCNICGKSFLMKSLLSMHILNHTANEHQNQRGGEHGGVYNLDVMEDNEELADASTDEMIYGDDVSETDASGGFQNRSPCNGETRKWPCTVCGKNMRAKQFLVNHMNLHLGLRPFNCGKCGKSYTIAGNLQRHLKAHEVKQHLECGKCFKICRGLNHLSKHMLAHEKAQPYPCDKCKVTFDCNAELEQHMLTHTRGRPYQCDLCSRTYGHKESLAKHLATHLDGRFQKEKHGLKSTGDGKDFATNKNETEKANGKESNGRSVKRVYRRENTNVPNHSRYPKEELIMVEQPQVWNDSQEPISIRLEPNGRATVSRVDSIYRMYPESEATSVSGTGGTSAIVWVDNRLTLVTEPSVDEWSCGGLQFGRDDVTVELEYQGVL